MVTRMKYVGLLVLVAVLASTFAIAKELKKKNDLQMSEQVNKTIMKNYPEASILKVDNEENDFQILEVEMLLQDGKKIEAMIAADGTIMQMETLITENDLPFDISKVLPANATIDALEGRVTYAVLKPVKLENELKTYELAATIDGNKVEIEVASDGTVLKYSIENEDNEEDHDNNGWDDEDGEEDDDHDGYNDDDHDNDEEDDD